jgi:hypothetical protein
MALIHVVRAEKYQLPNRTMIVALMAHFHMVKTVSGVFDQL